MNPPARHPVRHPQPVPPRFQPPLYATLPIAITAAVLWPILLGAGINAAAGTDEQPRQQVRIVERPAADRPPLPPSMTTIAPTTTPPKVSGLPVVVSGDYAEQVRIRSFKPTRDGLGMFAVKLRLEHIAGDDIDFMGVKVVALRGEEIVATADGFVESLAEGQTITTEPFSGDAFPRSQAGLSYEIEVGS